jgi:flavin-dependent dehydrogenase
MSIGKNYDVIIIGGGPAGSTAAAVLAEHGRRVLVLEKEKFPRYHIGESLMPYCYFPLERIGVLDKIKESAFTDKYSVQFVSTNGRVSQPFYFFQHLDHPASTTWQVWRADFDLILLNNAREKGATVLEQTRAKEILQEDGRVVGVRAESAEHGMLELRAPMTIDASGRDALAVARNGWRVMDEKLKKIALWTYYKGAARDPGKDEGATTIAYVPEKGWFWYIPLPGDIVGVGIVAEKDYLFRYGRDYDAIFKRELCENMWVKSRVDQGVQCDKYYLTGEFSYRSQHCATNGMVLVGDAFAFLDPVFSSGLFLALWSGEKAGDAVHKALETGDTSAAQFTEYGDQMRYGLESMRKLIYAFYDHDFNFRDLVDRYPEIKGDLTDCLLGHLFRDFTRLFEAVTDFVELPAALPHGTPLTQPLCASSS